MYSGHVSPVRRLGELEGNVLTFWAKTHPLFWFLEAFWVFIDIFSMSKPRPAYKMSLVSNDLRSCVTGQKVGRAN